MLTEFYRLIRPHLIATQLVASRRKIDIDEITRYCSDPNEVESSGRKALYKVMSDLFALYKVEQPTSLYEVTPHTINVYATTYAKYVLKRPVPEYTDMLEWGTMMQDIFSAQRGNSWQLFVPLLQLNPYGADTLELSVFICNMLALALNSQPIILTPNVYAAIKAYIADEQWQAVEELIMFYARYREFLSPQYAFAYYLYLGTVQFGYPEPMSPDGSLSFALACGEYTLKAKYASGAGDWLLTIYSKSKQPIGSVSYTQVSTRCKATGNVTAQLLSELWYIMPDYFTRTTEFPVGLFSTVFKHLLKKGKRKPLVISHLRENYEWESGEWRIICYRTTWSSIIYVRKSKRLLGIIEFGNGSCYCNNPELEVILQGIDLGDNKLNVSLAEVLTQYICENRATDKTVTRTVVGAMCMLFEQYDIRGLDIMQQDLLRSKD